MRELYKSAIFIRPSEIISEESMSYVLRLNFDAESHRRVKYRLLAFLLDSGIKSISPSFSLMTGISYPDLLRNVTINRGLQQRLLEELSNEGFLKRELVTRAVACPKCGSFEVATKYYCPFCGSFNIEKLSLISHRTCGFIGTNRDFKREDGKLICPKCGEALEEGSYTVMGRVLECAGCKARFDQPLIRHKCLRCGHEFDVLEARYVPIYKYIVDTSKVHSIVREVAKELLSSALTEMGFKLSDDTITGRSGIIHAFDIVAVRDDMRVGIDIIPPGTKEQDAFKVFAVSFGKIIDLSDTRILLAVPEDLGRNLPTLANDAKNFSVVRYKRLLELPEAIKKLVSEGADKRQVLGRGTETSSETSGSTAP